MKLIIGLGNPGEKYEKTRHNAGFLVVNTLAQSYQAKWKLESKFKSKITEIVIHDEKIILAKPTVYMNLSGESVSLLKHYYKTDLNNLIIIYDDKDMVFGKIRTRSSGRSGGHNGIKSIIQHLGTDQFLRLKIGIGNTNNQSFNDASSFVLGKFQKEEWKILQDDIIPDCLDTIEETLF
jgi:peptidyl-tRNA hydrolase, PTH1 family